MPKPAFDARLKAMANHLRENRDLIQPHEYVGMIYRAKIGLTPQDVVTFQLYLNGQQSS